MKNIAIIVLDGLRAKNLSLYGYNKETDKTIKEIAKESIVFNNHISTSNSTTPSITSLFTGKYPSTHGIIHQLPYTKQEEIDKLKKEKFWFPTYLKTKGYSTIGICWIGIWFKRGFDFYGEKEENTKRLLNNPLIKKILLSLPSWAYNFGKKMTKIRSSPSSPPASKTMDLAMAKIKESNKPFFLYVHFLDSHFPFATTKNPKLTGKNDMEDILNDVKENSQKEYIKKRLTDINLNSLEDIKNKYDLSIKNLDNEIKRFVKFLKKENLWDDTILIITSDHGENFGEHGIYFSHAGIYEDSIHTPLIMKIPGIEHKDVDLLVQNIDVIPTILEILNENKMDEIGFDGKSMINLIKKNEPIRDVALSFDGIAEDVRGARTIDRKIIVSRNNKCYLCKASHHKSTEEYDLKNDPLEIKNIYKEGSSMTKYLDLL
jgi:arylsulfatase